MPDGFTFGQENLTGAAIGFCRDRLDALVLGSERPGRPGCQAVRVFLDSGPVVVTRRAQPERARLEADVLSELAAAGAPVPEVLAFDGELLIQRDLGPYRLADAFDMPDDPGWIDCVDQALHSLGSIQTIAREARLAERVPEIGTVPGWFDNLMSAPSRIGERLILPTPLVDEAAVRGLLHSPNRSFVKWDARPINAALCENGTVAWFDWQHCGKRDPLDDLVWLLSDERTPDQPEIEAALIDRHLTAIAGPDYRGDAFEYLMAFGAFHMCIRLHVMLNRKGDDAWLSQHLDDGTGVTLEAAQRSCRRAARWASWSNVTAPLSDWLRAVSDILATLPPTADIHRMHLESATVH